MKLLAKSDDEISPKKNTRLHCRQSFWDTREDILVNYLLLQNTEFSLITKMPLGKSTLITQI